MSRAHWEFAYSPLPPERTPNVEDEWVVCTSSEVSPGSIVTALRGAGEDAHAASVLARAPLFWHRLTLGRRLAQPELEALLADCGVRHRYVTSARHGSPVIGSMTDFSVAPRATPLHWQARPAREHDERPTLGRWFVHEHEGVEVLRSVSGTGAGSRLAVIDDEARNADALDLDAEVCVGIEKIPRGSSHGASMIAWAVGSRGRPGEGLPPFVGVAPDASPRLYVMPRPEAGVVALPLAIVRAVEDGADVVVCATYVEGLASPLLDDALEFASRLGRGGRGTAVIMPTGREISSPPGSMSASLTLRLLDPASDPRVLCVGPSGRNGGWFLWTDKHGLTRPFANRGPAVRVTAPGDDIAFPFAADERLGHAESSGAAAIAGGVAALVLATNPELTSNELYAILCRTARQDRTRAADPIGDPSDLLPDAPDRDGHDARCGHGRLSAVNACLAAEDPIAAALLLVGEERAARRYHALGAERAQSGYSKALGRRAARLMLTDPTLQHIVCVLVRHLRLVAHHEDWRERHGAGAMVRLVVLGLRQLRRTLRDDSDVREEVERLDGEAARATRSPAALERELAALAQRMFPRPAQTTERIASRDAITDAAPSDPLCDTPYSA